MFKIMLSLLSVFVLANGSDYNRANATSADALGGLDCEFEECSKPKPKVIIKEKVIYRDRPVVIVKEKVVYKERPIEVAPARRQDIEKITPSRVVEGRTYNKAFFDVHTKSQAPMLDYIKYTNRSSFDVEQFADTVSKIKEKGAKIYIHGSIAVPDSIRTTQVYMSVGQKYHYKYYSYWIKEIHYNNQITRQNSDYFLVNVKKDSSGNRYVDYKIYIRLDTPWTIKPAEENVAPNTYFFKMAPKTRGFKNKFIRAKPYIIEE